MAAILTEAPGWWRTRLSKRKVASRQTDRETPADGNGRFVALPGLMYTALAGWVPGPSAVDTGVVNCQR